jgi:hemerythrin-like metal-binding protein
MMITLPEDLKVGIAKIDEQHRDLLNRVNTLSETDSQNLVVKEIEKTLDLLGTYVVQHFNDEEEIQKQCNFPKYEWHKEQHTAFISTFQHLKAEFIASGATAIFIMKLVDTLSDWLVNHIKGADVEIGKHYKEYCKADP